MPTERTPTIAGHLIVECLVAQGVTHAFGVPGESYLAVLDGFHAWRDHIRFVINRQEGGAADGGSGGEEATTGGCVGHAPDPI